MKFNASGNSGGSWFLIFKNLVPPKRQVLELKIHLDLCYPVLCGHCLPSCQAEHHTPGLHFLFKFTPEHVSNIH